MPSDEQPLGTGDWLNPRLVEEITNRLFSDVAGPASIPRHEGDAYHAVGDTSAGAIRHADPAVQPPSPHAGAMPAPAGMGGPRPPGEAQGLWPGSGLFHGDDQLQALLRQSLSASSAPGQLESSDFYFMPKAVPQSAPVSQAAPSGASQPRLYFVPDPPHVQPISDPPFDAHGIRKDFPALDQNVHGKQLIWFDNAATTQKPQSVIDALARFYEHDNSNIHRGAHALAARATEAYEGARDKVRHFLGASSATEIIFVRGTTEGVNLVAQTYGRKYIKAGDEIVLPLLEHHSNIVPWQMLAQEVGAVLRVAPINDRGEVLMEEYARLLGPRTRMVALSQVSNALGTVLPVQEMTELAHRYGARVLVDGAQAVAHQQVDVQRLGVDFYVFSSHKLFGPTGIGVVYGRRELLDAMPPWQGGGNMIRDVSFEETTYNDVPAKFEAGTPSIAAAVGLGAAIDYVSRIGLELISRYERELTEYAGEGLSHVPGLRAIGTASDKVGVLSFVLRDKPPEDVGRFLDREGIAVRAGHHCAQPTMRRFGVTGTVRPSLAFYNTCEEIDALIAALHKLQAVR